MTVESSLTFFVAIFIFGITPGPGVFAIIARSMTQGARASVTLCVGMTAADILYLVMACLGLAVIAQTMEGLFLAIRYLGAAYLIYLGWKMWKAPLVSHMEEVPVAKSSKQEMASLAQGFMISASNPKVILFYIAFLPTFMDLTILTTWDIALASVLAFVALMLGLTLVSVSVSQARRMMKSSSAMKALNRVAGSIMISAGGYLALRS
ncbi:LysE family translocator [Marinomonas posidonica]|uniref:Lysine exporter protein (LYSE/YGGA) n=1 Tax=Marinomonas posidonica (strain CECT 7376 / NCIMB 14433 / IVIA-Po-181) TaxID=491952 RepID=F6CRQ6_MARPP|nr:LysE family translocator [Marinomonas posidonica]AEF53819.1 Lysine exporter protein (LYSE/YGGA) [Marinomonas posidonica IVIA-Po-181]